MRQHIRRELWKPNKRNTLRPFEAVYRELQRKARKHRRSCGLTYEQFLTFTETSECHYCGRPINWSKYNARLNGSGYYLDRTNNARGYSLDNCVVCCARCNRAKSNGFTYDEWWTLTRPFRRTEQMSKLKVGDVVVHKTLGNQPLVVVEINSKEPAGGEVLVRYAEPGQYGVSAFVLTAFHPKELETPLESIAREAEIFQALNEKRDEINGKSKPGPVGISHLN